MAEDPVIEAISFLAVPRIVALSYGLFSFVAFCGATQAYGDPFTLLILSSVPVLLEREAQAGEQAIIERSALVSSLNLFSSATR